jgi:hypothetical protein
MSDDLISRQAAEIAFVEKGQLSRRYKWGEVWELNYEEIRDVLNDLPSVQPAQKTGRWLINSDGYYPYCSICKNEPQGRIMTDYCPNCGAKMESEG